MRQSKRFFGICLFLLSLLTAGSNTICAQQEIMSYDLSDSWYSRELNPAFCPADRKVHLGLACVGADVWTDTGLELQDFRKMFGGGLTEDAYQAYLFRLKERSQVAMDVRTEALSLGFNIRGGNKQSVLFRRRHLFRNLVDSISGSRSGNVIFICIHTPVPDQGRALFSVTAPISLS